MSGYEETMCRVCLQNYNEDYESVFVEDTENSELSPLGLLYEELTMLSIQHAAGHPQYLCNYCILQLKLFHKFKTKAVESHLLFTQATAKESKTSVYELEYIPDKEIDDVVKPIDRTIKIEDTSTLDLGPFKIEDHYEDDRDDEEDDGEEEEKVTGDEIDNEFEDVQYLDDDIDESNMGESEDMQDNNEEVGNRWRQSTGMYPCKTCNQEFVRKMDLLKHRREAHKREQFVCNQCPKKFFSESQLQVHLNVHWGLPAYRCELCGKEFKQKVHHVNHMNNHLNKRDVQCNLCGKGFLTKSDLKIHLRMHTGERRYECDICGKKFRAHTHMKNHRYTHLGKTFQCEYCQRLYTTPATLKIHIQSVHENLCPYSCSTCNKRFKRKHHLVAHMKIHSPKQENASDLLESQY